MYLVAKMFSHRTTDAIDSLYSWLLKRICAVRLSFRPVWVGFWRARYAT